MQRFYVELSPRMKFFIVFYLTIMVWIIVRDTGTGITFNQMKYNVDIYNESLKFWNNYITKFLILCLHRITNNNHKLHVSKFILKLTEISVDFTILCNKIVTRDPILNVTIINTIEDSALPNSVFTGSLLNLNSSYNLSGLTLTRNKSSMYLNLKFVPSQDAINDFLSVKVVVLKATGQLLILDNVPDILCIQYKITKYVNSNTDMNPKLTIHNIFIVTCRQVWTFNLDPRIKLNLTFHTIYFSSGSNNCHAGNVTVENISSDEESFLYCGYHSMFNLYPKWAVIDIVFSADKFSHFKINVSFSIIDPNLIISIPVSKNVTKISKIHIGSIFNLENKQTLLSYSIVVERIKFIILHVNEYLVQKYIIYDGPGYLSEMVSKFQNIYKTSTFQCLIHVLEETNFLPKMNFEVKFSAKQLNISVRLHTDEFNIIHAPFPTCHRNPCLLLIETIPGQHINITIYKLLYQGFTSFTCCHGGLVTGELINNKFKKSLTVCESIDIFKGESRNLYSSSSSLILILYWYKYYSSINITFNLSNTFCQPVHIDYCHHSFCIHNRKACDQHTAILKLNFTMEWNKDKNSWHILFISDGCLVLQLFRINLRHISKNEFYCFMSVVAKHKNQLQSHLTYFIRGKIKRHIFLKRKERVVFKGNTRLFCFNNRNVNKIKCRNLSSLKSSIYSVKQHHTDNINFILYAQTNPPQYIMEVITKFYKHRQSWMDIIMWNKHASLNESVYHLIEKVPISRGIYKLKTWRVLSHVLHLSKDVTRVLKQIKIKVYVESDGMYSTGIILIWESPVLLSTYKSNKYISLPGKISKVELGFEGMIPKNNKTLNIKWLRENYKSYEFSLLKNKIMITIYNKQFTFYLHRSVYENEMIEKLISWETALQFCKKIGEDMPTFTDKRQLEEFIALVKSSLHIPPLEGIYIGLKLNTSRQVGDQLWMI